MSKKNLIGLIVLIAFLLVIPRFFGNPYYLGVLVWSGLYSLICMGLSLFMGYCGQISLGQAGFYALGAYGSGILTARFGFEPWPALAVALVACVILALGVGLPTLRLKGHYLAMATLGFGVIIYVVADADPFGLTGGPSGFSGIPKLSVFGLALNDELRWYYFVWATVLIFLFFLLNLVNSRVGRALRSIHGGETAAKAMGVNVAKYKTQAFLLSAAMASVAGSFYAHYVGFVNPEPFNLELSIHLVTMVVIGGVTNLWGAIAGTVLLTVLTEGFRTFFKEYRLLFDGLILVVIMLLFAEGLFLGAAKKVAALVARASCLRSRRRPGASTHSTGNPEAAS
ncbi:MAG: branched-chain amino acid ABC transporter permease [bacterium]|nr:branched-chain amino acid ABC transporter permease [bacterium]